MSLFSTEKTRQKLNKKCVSLVYQLTAEKQASEKSLCYTGLNVLATFVLLWAYWRNS